MTLLLHVAGAVTVETSPSGDMAGATASVRGLGTAGGTNETPGSVPSATDDVPRATNDIASAIDSVPDDNTGAENPGATDTTASVGSCSAGDGTCTAGDGMSADAPPFIAPPGCDSILDIALATPNLSTLVAAVQAADLTGTVANENATVTVLAPSNAAFAQIPTDELNKLLANKANLTKVCSLLSTRGKTTLAHKANCHDTELL